MGTKRLRKAGGVTLIELLVVMSIIGVLLLIAAPNMARWRSNLDVTTDVRAVTAELARARSEAIRTRSNVAVSFTERTISWRVEGEAAPQGTYTLSTFARWDGSVPASFTYSGLGLIPAFSTVRTLGLTDGHSQLSISINPNGHAEL